MSIRASIAVLVLCLIAACRPGLQMQMVDVEGREHLNRVVTVLNSHSHMLEDLSARMLVIEATPRAMCQSGEEGVMKNGRGSPDYLNATAPDPVLEDQ